MSKRSHENQGDQYTIRPYVSADNAALAVMWNESDDQWPGTFTGGVPYTEERVRDWMDKETCLMRLVVEQEGGGAIVGYGSLWESAGREGCCYVALFNVHPAHQKRSLARHMLTQMVDWAAENGYRRMTIGTWPANLRSVPLYKKTGFFWIPDTNVHMENYVPLVRGLPAARGFFERHDWYTTFCRELEQVEDDQRHPATGEMKVYVYRWEADGEFVEAVVDRQGQALTGLATPRFDAHAVVDGGEPAQGVAYPVRWRVANRRDEPVQVSLLADGDPGINLSRRDSFTLAAGEERVVEASFTCGVDAPRLDPDEEKPAPRIRTTLVVGGEVVELGTGLRYRPAVEIGAEPAVPSLLPGRSQVVHLRLRNRAGRPLKGSVRVAPQEGLATDWTAHEFEIAAKGYAGLPLAVTCERAGVFPLALRATFADGDRQVTTEPQTVLLSAAPLGGVAAGKGEDRVVVENDFFQVVFDAWGGGASLRSRALQEREVYLCEEIGPPFTPRELGDKKYDVAFDRGEGWARVTLAAKSTRFPGVSLTREMRVTTSPLVEVRYRMVNDGDGRRDLQVQPRFQLSGGDAGRVVLPRAERLVQEHAGMFPAANGDFPKKADGMAEQWLARERDGQVAGIVWDGDAVEHEMGWWGWFFLRFAERGLEPQEAAAAGTFTIYAGPGDWRDVQRVWQRAAGVETVEGWGLLQPGRPHALGLSPLVALGGEIEARLTVSTVRERQLEGSVAIEPPPGWTVDCAVFPVKGVRDGEPLEEAVHLTAAGDGVGAAGGRLYLEADLFDEVRPFTLIRLGDAGAPVRVAEREEAGYAVWDVDNGRCLWAVAPRFHGGVTAWREAGGEANHLLTSFPRDGEIGWLKPWFGGVRPTLVAAGPGDAPGWPGKLHEAAFEVAPYEAPDGRGIPWQGVRLAASLEREGFEGLRAEITYLTVGVSNVLRVVYRLVNETSARRRVRPGLLTYVQVDGEHADGVLHGEGVQRKRTPHDCWAASDGWGAVLNPASGRAMAVVPFSGRRKVWLLDEGADGGHLFVEHDVLLEPHGSGELAVYLALAGSLEEARLYEAMGQ